MKKIATLLIVVAVVFSLAACNNKPQQEKIEITASQETIEFREALYKRTGYLYKTEEEIMAEYNEVWLPYLNARTEQVFPDITTTNTLSKESFDYGDVYTLTGSKQDNVVLYIHGGAFVWEINENHVSFCDKLVDSLGAKVYMPIYPLGPEANYEETYQMIEKVYDELLKLNKPIFIMGDSAGATITLGFTLKLKDSGKKLPNKVVVMAPAADCSFSNSEMDDYQPRDGMLFKKEIIEYVKLWTKDADLTIPQISPLYGDYKDFPDTLMFVGDCDILCADDLKLYDKMCEAGMNATLVMGKDLWHVFSIFDISEKAKSLEIISEFCK